MKVTVSVMGRFHAFDLARELERRHCLARLQTSYPAFEAVRHGLPRAKVRSAPWAEALSRAFRTAHWKAGEPLSGSLYDQWSAATLKEGSDLFVGWSGSSLLSLHRAKALGMTTIVERGSSHMLYQTETLEHEYRCHGLEFRETHARTIEREIAEYETADFISVPSEMARKTFLWYGIPEHKLFCVPYGYAPDLFHRRPRRDPRFRVIFCGALTLRKGVQYLIRAFTELCLPNAVLSLVGTLSPEIARLFPRELSSPQVFLYGSRPQRDLERYLSEADVFCLPSVEDGFGLVVPQAMACRLPAICASTTGASEIIRDGIEGFVIPSRSVQALKEKIQWCYDNRTQCEAMGYAAEARAREGFTWNAYGERVHRAYRDRLEASHRASS